LWLIIQLSQVHGEWTQLGGSVAAPPYKIKNADRKELCVMSERIELIRIVLNHPELVAHLEEILQSIKKQIPDPATSEEFQK